MKYSIQEGPKYTLVEIDTEGPIVPADLAMFALPSIGTRHGEVPPDRGVILSGRAPIWVYGALITRYCLAEWIATYDPRLGGAVVVGSYNNARRLGDVVPTVVPMEVA
ncbi:MAG: CRISPR-associated ring nuclease Crn3/Csx3 [Deltaproteobacteria bacterium]|nr:CRISPR-associated ring nuclease Crn3/Csx3 [Deltaproteobacteria bacterium]